MLQVYHTEVVPTKSKERYTGITVPESLVEKVKEIIESNRELGYVSVSEFVKDSVRRRIEEISRDRASEKEDNRRS